MRKYNSSKPAIVKKPNQTITISSLNLTLLQRKAYNVLMRQAYQDLKLDDSQTSFTISISQIKSQAGILATDNVHIKNELKALMEVQLESVEKASKDWGVFVLLSQVVKDGNYLRYEFPSLIREALIKNNFYTTLDLMVIKVFQSKYSIALYELAMRYNKVEIPKYSLDEFKRIMGCPFKRFPDIRRFAINPAIREINEKSDIIIDYEITKKGRKVTDIKFNIKKKETILPPQPKTKKKLDLAGKFIKIKKTGEVCRIEEATEGTFFALTPRKTSIAHTDLLTGLKDGRFEMHLSINETH